MASRPSTVPQLDTNQTYRTIPAPTKVTDGYAFEDPLPAANVNYLWGWAGDWLTWLDERTEDGTTPTTDFTLRGLDALTVTGDGGVLTLKGGDGGGTSGDGGDIVLIPGDQTSGEYGQVLVGASAPVTDFALVELNGPSRSAANGTDLMLVASGASNSYAEIGFASYDPTEYASWYVGAWGYQRASNPGKFYLLHYRNVAGAVVNTFPFVVDDTDRVGFGTATPTSQIHLYGTAPDITFEDTTGDKFLAGNNNGSFRIRNVTDTRDDFYIDGDGKIGVNTTSPDNWLHVFAGSSGTVTASSVAPLVVESSNYCWIQLLSTSSLGCGILFGEGTTPDVETGRIFYDHSPESMSFRVNSQDVMTLDANQRVNINTTGSAYRLEVDDKNASGSLVALFRNSTATDATDTLIAVGRGYANDQAAVLAHHYDTDGATSSYTLLTNAGAAAGTGLYLKDGAVVGINTSNPYGILHIFASDAGTVTPVASTVLTLERNGDCYLSLLSPDANERAIFFGEPTSNIAGSIIYNDAATPDGLQFRVNGNQTKFHIRSDGNTHVVGNLGVGTAPSDAIHIYHADPYIRYQDSGGGDVFVAGVDGGVFRIRNVTDARNDFTIDGSGNAGFNETTPLGFVHIRKADAGSVTVSNDGDELIIENSTNAGLSIVCPDSYTGFIVFTNDNDVSAGVIKYIHTSDKMEFQVNNGNTALSLYSAGEVYAPFIYSDDIVAKTPLALYVGSDGQIGISSSTVRNKTNIADLADVDWLYDLRPIEFEPKKADGTGTGERRMGLLAEEVEKVKQSLCFYERENGGRVQGIHYLELITPILKALQQQRETIASLSARLQAANL